MHRPMHVCIWYSWAWPCAVVDGGVQGNVDSQDGALQGGSITSLYDVAILEMGWMISGCM